MRDEGVIYVAGHPLLNRRCKDAQGVSIPPKLNFFNNLIDVFETKLTFKGMIMPESVV